MVRISCISNEIKIGKVNGIYDAKKAEAKAVLRRRESKIQCLKVAADTNLKKFVIEGMLEDQSPEGISGRLKEVEKYSICKHQSHIQICGKSYGRQIEKHLYHNAVKKKSGPKNKKKVSIDGRTMIDQRPKKERKLISF